MIETTRATLCRDAARAYYRQAEADGYALVKLGIVDPDTVVTKLSILRATMRAHRRHHVRKIIREALPYVASGIGLAAISIGVLYWLVLGGIHAADWIKAIVGTVTGS